VTDPNDPMEGYLGDQGGFASPDPNSSVPWTSDYMTASRVCAKGGQLFQYLIWRGKDGEPVIHKRELGPVPVPPTAEELADRATNRERVAAFLADLDAVTKKHGLALGNSCGVYDLDDAEIEGHRYTARDGLSNWTAIEVSWRQAGDSERVEFRNEPEYVVLDGSGE
jgi:hypothetical protein